jgi:predicted nucleic acid-binding protein
VLVVDASLVVELCIDRIGEEAGVALDGEGQLVAPVLLWSEVPSVLHAMAFRREISHALAEKGLKRFLAGKIKVAERRPKGLTKAAWQVAEEFGWAKTYDAEYVALARMLKCRLVTLDGRLRDGADRLGFVVTPTELAELD